MPLLRCPVCQKSFEESDSAAMPFCSSQCRSVDLWGWLSEERGLPTYGAVDNLDDEEYS